MVEKRYGCPVEVTLDVIGGKWKCSILWWLRRGTKRFSELMQLMSGVSQKVLTQQLRELEADGLIERQAYRESPPRVEYSLTPYGETLRPITELMCEWGKNHSPKFHYGLIGMRILLVADEVEQSQLEIELSQVRGALVSRVSLEVAVSSLNQNPPDIVLVDVSLSDDFRVLIASIRKLETQFKVSIPTLAITATDEARRSAFAQGFKIHLMAPVEIYELVGTITNLTRRFKELL